MLGILIYNASAECVLWEEGLRAGGGASGGRWQMGWREMGDGGGVMCCGGAAGA